MTIISENIDEDKKTNTTHKKRGLQAEVSAIDGNSKRHTSIKCIRNRIHHCSLAWCIRELMIQKCPMSCRPRPG